MKSRVNTLHWRTCKHGHKGCRRGPRRRADHYQTAHVRRDSALDPRRLVLATEGRGTERRARTICFFKCPSANIYLATSWHVWGAASSQDRRATVIFKMLQTSGFDMILTLLMSNKLQMSFVCNNCSDVWRCPASWQRRQKQIDNLVIYQEIIWNKIAFFFFLRIWNWWLSRPATICRTVEIQ